MDVFSADNAESLFYCRKYHKNDIAICPPPPPLINALVCKSNTCSVYSDKFHVSTAISYSLFWRHSLAYFLTIRSKIGALNRVEPPAAFIKVNLAEFFVEFR